MMLSVERIVVSRIHAKIIHYLCTLLLLVNNIIIRRRQHNNFLSLTLSAHNKKIIHRRRARHLEREREYRFCRFDFSTDNSYLQLRSSDTSIVQYFFQLSLLVKLGNHFQSSDEFSIQKNLWNGQFTTNCL